MTTLFRVPLVALSLLLAGPIALGQSARVPKELRPEPGETVAADQDAVFPFEPGEPRLLDTLGGQRRDSRVPLGLVAMGGGTLEELMNEPAHGAHVTWPDGKSLPGHIVGADETRLQLRSPFFAEPLVLDLRALHSIQLEPKLTPDASSAPDQLILPDGMQSRGSVLVDEGSLRWRPAGGFNFSRLMPGHRLRFVLGSAGKTETFDLKPFPAKVYLVGGDVLPCRVESIDETFLDAATPLGDTRRIPVGAVKAVELAGSGNRNLGVHDIDWRVESKGGVEQTREKNSEFVEFVEDRDKMVFRSDGIAVTPRFPESGTLSTRCSIRWPDKPVGKNLSLKWSSPVIRKLLQPEQYYGIAIQVTSDREVMARIWIVEEGGVTQAMKSLPLGPDRTTRLSLVATNGAIEQISLDARKVFQRPETFGDPPETRCDQLRIHADAGVVVSDFMLNETSRISVDDQARRQTLIVPRFRRENPSTHVLIARNGDLLRGWLLGLDEKVVRFRSGKDELEFDRSNMAALVWLHPEGPTAEPDVEPDAELIQARLEWGNLVTLVPEKMTEESLTGRSPVLGPCTIPRGTVHELRVGRHDALQDVASYSDWVQSFSISPRQLATGLGTVGAPVGKEAGGIDLPLLDGGRFKMSECAGQVVVLSFWASWCAPCVTGIPMCTEAIKKFDPSEVRFIAVNQGESAELAKELVGHRGWEVDVALDAEESVAEQLGIDTIPHTLVIDKTGIVRRSQSGFGPRTGEELKQVIEELINDSSSKLPGS